MGSCLIFYLIESSTAENVPYCIRKLACGHNAFTSENLQHSIKGMARRTSPRCRWTNNRGKTLFFPPAIFKHSTSIRIRSGLAVGTRCLIATFFSPSLTRNTFENVPSPTVLIGSSVGHGAGNRYDRATLKILLTKILKLENNLFIVV